MKTFVLIISFCGAEIAVRKVVKANDLPEAVEKAYREAGVYGSVESMIVMDAQRIYAATDS